MMMMMMMIMVMMVKKIQDISCDCDSNLFSQTASLAEIAEQKHVEKFFQPHLEQSQGMTACLLQHWHVLHER